MNKFGLLLLVLTIGVSVQQTNIDINKLYDKFAILVRGLANSEDYKCSATLVSKKAEMLGIINKILAEVKAGKKFIDAVKGHLFDFLGVDGLGSNCNLFKVANTLLNLMNEAGVKTIGNNIANNSKAIYGLFNDILTKESLDEKLVAAGKIIKIVTNIYVL